MERLTEKDEQGNKLVLKNSVECIGEELRHWSIRQSPTGTQTIRGYAVDKLAEYEDQEEQGLLLKLKCKVGNIVYFPDEDFNYIFPVTISQIIISDLGEGKYCVQYNGCFFNGYGDPEKDFEFDEEDFGKTVFPTQAEAEEALKKMETKES